MILAIPVSQSDVQLLPNLAKNLKQTGPYTTHHLAVFPDKTVEQQGRELEDAIKGLFISSRVIPVSLGIIGWPVASNRHFREVAAHIANLGLKEAFYFFEADNVVVGGTGWLDRIQAEYIKHNKPYMGVVVPTRGFRLHDAGGGKTQRVAENGEPHMVGTGIYPPNFAQYSVKLANVDRIVPWNRLPIEPFDVALRHEVVSKAHNTDRIQHNWQTCNYRVEDGALVCDDMPNLPDGTSHKKPWNGVADIIHGCKDGSLSSLAIAGKLPVVSTTPRVAVARENATDSCAPPAAGVDESSGNSKPQPPTFLATKIRKLVLEKSKTAKALAEECGVEIANIFNAVSEPAAGLKVGGPAKWVSIK